MDLLNIRIKMYDKTIAELTEQNKTNKYLKYTIRYLIQDNTLFIVSKELRVGRYFKDRNKILVHNLQGLLIGKIFKNWHLTISYDTLCEKYPEFLY